jgi:hypothetical protein
MRWRDSEKIIFNRVYESASGLTCIQCGEAATEGGRAQTDKPIATKNTKKASSHTVDFRALISAANRVPAKYDFANRETATPIGALFITESTQRPFVRPLAKPRRVFFVAIGLLV